MKIIDINNRIEKEYNKSAYKQLLDVNMMNEYKQSKSTKSEIDCLINIMKKFTIDDNIINNVINEYTPNLIKAGTKGSLKGVKFNKIVKNYITNLNLDEDRFEICFEKQCPNNKVSEKPDWYIKDKELNKVIIGMNQLTLWGGGHHTNRGSNYVVNNKYNTKSTKFVSVVCNKVTIKSTNTKLYELFNVGYSNNTLCYLNNLENIIKSHFNLND